MEPSKHFVSQRTMVQVARALRERRIRVNFTELLYAKDFPDWFVTHADTPFGWDWMRILMALRNGTFFVSEFSFGPRDNITGEHLSSEQRAGIGEWLIQKLAALATLPP